MSANSSTADLGGMDFLESTPRKLVTARFGFVRIEGVRRLACSSAASQALLLNVLQIADQAELTRRLRLGMHRLTQAEYDAIMRGAMGEAK